MGEGRNYGAFFELLKQMPGAERGDIVAQYTSGRTTSLKEMTQKEYYIMLSALRIRVVDIQKLKSARSAALRQLQLYGINTMDWQEVNRFVSQPRITGKVFAKLTILDLIGLTRKMRKIIAKGESKALAEATEQYNQRIIAQSISKQKGS